MQITRLALGLLCVLVILPARGAALACTETAERNAYELGSTHAVPAGDWISRITQPTARSEPVEVYGAHSYRERMPNGWVITLLNQPAGWSFRLYAQAPGAESVDLSAITPPFRGPNTRDLFGWHFRNADNTGPNQGDVNAPQRLRPFEFSEGLIGTGGFKPPPGPPHGEAERPAHAGRGWLEILDFGLADLNVGDRARMNYVKLRGCLTWPKSVAEASAYRDRTELAYAPEMAEIMGRCGLDLDRYRLAAQVAPRALAGDFDGEGAHDEVVQVTDQRTGLADLAICRAGTWHTVVSGLSNDAAFKHTVAALERWQLVGGDFADSGTDRPASWPAATGDVLVLERIEKALYLVYFSDGTFGVQKVFPAGEPD